MENIPAQPQSLFDTAISWTSEPRLAFESFISSPTYRDSSRAKTLAPIDRPMLASSAKVYRAMFNKYLTFLEAKNKAFVAANEHDAEQFLVSALARSSADTQMRYARMLERAYRRAMEVGAIAYNPAAEVINLHNMKTPARHVPEDVSSEQVRRILQWLGQHIELQLSFESKLLEMDDAKERKRQMLVHDGASFGGLRPWRIARALAAASLSLGAGLRSAEIVKMTVNQVRYDADAGPHERFRIDIPAAATVKISRNHNTKLDAAAARGLQAWWEFRTMRMSSMLADPKNVVMFPAGKNGERLDAGTLFVNLKPVAKLAMAQGVVDDTTLWILTGGATALRRAYIVSGLRRGEHPELMTQRLGHWEDRSMRRYIEALPDLAGERRPRAHAKSGT